MRVQVLIPVAAVAAIAVLASPIVAAPAKPSKEIQSAVSAPSRTEANVLRDKYRHPAETLAFFGVRPDQTVIEITPGAGWYSEILAPYLANGGQYIGAMPAAAPESGGGKRNVGINARVYTNQGPKGPALKAILDEYGASRAFFIDDLPQHHGSVAEVTPHVTRLHLCGEPMLAPHIDCAHKAGHAHARIDEWAAALPWLLDRIHGDNDD